MSDRENNLKDDSGTIYYSDPLTSFIYELLRDHITCGAMESLVRNIIVESGKEVVFTNGWLAQYSNNVANTIRNASKEKQYDDADEVWRNFKEHGDADTNSVQSIDNNDRFKNYDDEVTDFEESNSALKMLISSGQISSNDAADILNDINNIMSNNKNDNIQIDAKDNESDAEE